MKSWIQLCLWEARQLLRGGALRWVCGALLAAGLLALWSGDRRLARHASEIAGLPGHLTTQMEAVARQFTPDGEAGYVAYYAFLPTHHPLAPLAALSVGLRDVVPSVIWVRLLGLEGQLYEADLGNPALQALGNFDFAFVCCVLAPLALLLLGHDALARERDAGRLPLLAAQGVSLGRLLAIRVLLAWGAVAATLALTFALAVPWVGLSVDALTLTWFGTALGHLAVWAALAALVAAAARSVATSLAVSLAGWIGAVVLLPAVLNLALVTALPVSDGLEITVRQRQETHGAWDRPRADVMNAFFAHRPQWADTPPVTGRFAWRWYYAMHEMSDRSVADLGRTYRANLRARQDALIRFAWLAPSAYAQLRLNHLARTDLDAHLAYLDEVRAFHERLRDHFYPLVFADARITPADYAAFPAYAPPASPVSAAPPPFWPLLLTGIAALFATHRFLQRPILS